MQAPSGPAVRRALDPYLGWAALTRGRYLARGATGPWRLAWQLLPGKTEGGLVDVSGLERIAARGPGLALRSAELTPASQGALEALGRHADFVLAEPGLCPVGGLTSASPLALRPSRGAVRALGKPLVIGVIDGQCGFANAAFCKGPGQVQSRLDHFWDQGADPSGPWLGTAPYGRDLDQAALDRLLRNFASPSAVGAFGTRAAAEAALYRHLGHAEPTDSDWSHGTVVLDLALRELDATCQAMGHAAEDAGIVYVQLPQAALQDTSARWAASHVSDALDFILARAGDEAQVVVNLSLGAFAGPHDGTSLLERALDEAIERRSNKLTVVVAAGNAARVSDDATGEVRLCRRRCRLAAGGSAKLIVDLDTEDRTETFVEMWLSPPTQGAPVTVTLEAPNSAPITAAAGGAPAVLRQAPSGEPIAALFNGSGDLQVPNGSRCLVLLAIGHTSKAHPPCAPLGHWVVKLSNRSAEPVVVDAWVERRDVPGELPGERPQYGFDPASDGESTASTMGSLANGRQTIVVGAVERDEHDRRRYVVGEYSSTGGRIDVLATGTLEGAGFLTGSRKELAGTSIAAASVSGAAAALALGAPQGRDALLQALRRLASGRAARLPAGPGGAGMPPGVHGFVLPPGEGVENKPG
ncbi:MAG: hypothetical protein JNJ89_02920 [Rubrivivax sp.]|nr:hypothetical protein [Rubrivivax sp.]